MSSAKELLEKRKGLKKKKPLFIRKDIYKKKKLGKSWRKPRGLDNKQRLCKRGVAKIISSGYRAPAEIRGLHNSGLTPVIVSSMSQIASLTKEQGIILSAKLGNGKRQMLIEEIKKKNLKLLNMDADKTIEKIQAKLKQRQAQKKKHEQKKEKKSIEEKIKKEEAKKKELEKQEPQKKGAEAEELKKEEAALSEEDKKKLEKEEKDKLLIKRE